MDASVNLKMTPQEFADVVTALETARQTERAIRDAEGLHPREAHESREIESRLALLLEKLAPRTPSRRVA